MDSAPLTGKSCFPLKVACSLEGQPSSGAQQSKILPREPTPPAMPTAGLGSRFSPSCLCPAPRSAQRVSEFCPWNVPRRGERTPRDPMSLSPPRAAVPLNVQRTLGCAWDNSHLRLVPANIDFSQLEYKPSERCTVSFVSSASY